LPRSYLKICLWIFLLAGCGLRLTGLSRGLSDWEDPPRLYHFHPDEDRLVRDALNLKDPFVPPLSSYGPVSHYAVRGAVEFASLFWRDPRPGYTSPRAEWKLFLVARSTALILSVCTLFLLYGLAGRVGGKEAAIVAVFLYAFSPLAIQQAHFYAIDGLFAAVSLAALYAIVVAVESDDWKRLALAGMMIGVCGAVRLVGLGLVVVFVAGMMSRRPSREVVWPASSLGRLALGLGATFSTLLFLAPYLVNTASSILSAGFETAQQGGLADATPSTVAQLRANAIGVARGTILRPWTLIDTDTQPYLHQVTHLLPQAVGWPLALTSLIAVLWTVFNLRRTRAPLLAWSATYFVVIGALHTKHVRYLLPLLPVLAVFAAELCLWLKSKSRTIGLVWLSVLMGFTAMLGTAFAHVYTVEDSRLQAVRWMTEHATVGSRIGIEGGAFSLNPLLDASRYEKRHLEISELFRSRGYAMCTSVLSFLQKKVAGLDYLAITDVNRYRQFLAVPAMFPVVSGFYDRLIRGNLGFDPVREIRVYPELAGFQLRDDEAEPAFIGFDHPTTWILQRRESSASATSWEEWRRALDNRRDCPDGQLRRAAAALHDEDWGMALQNGNAVLEHFPDMKVAWLINAAAYYRRGQVDEARKALDAYRLPYRADAAAQGPWATAATLVELGLAELVLWSKGFG
jgi:hypothetical protein